MAKSIIWLHEDAMRISHPVFRAAPAGARVVYIWDDAYLRARRYSLKRLVFMYETLCAMPIEILRGDMATILTNLDVADIYVPSSTNPTIRKTIAALSVQKNTKVVADEPFACIATPRDFTRFFQIGRAHV